MQQFFSYSNLSFRYQPFPIGLAAPLFQQNVYDDLVANFPSLEKFEYMEKHGRKYSLSLKSNPKEYKEIIHSVPVWRDFHAYIRQPAFIRELLETLRHHHIDLGYRRSSNSLRKQLRSAWSLVRHGHPIRLNRRLQTRFEFSMLPADGGHILPHTDSPNKIVTIIVSMATDGEWKSEFGGGTDVNRPLKPKDQYNYLNEQANFSDMEVLHTYEFAPNQGIVFVKTFNSWHSVRPMSGVGSSLMRRTLTINVEEV